MSNVIAPELLNDVKLEEKAAVSDDATVAISPQSATLNVEPADSASEENAITVAQDVTPQDAIVTQAKQTQTQNSDIQRTTSEDGTMVTSPAPNTPILSEFEPPKASTQPTVEHKSANTVIIGGPQKQKSLGTALLLTFFFGPLGMFYSTVLGAVVMFFANVFALFFTFGLGMLVLWPIQMLWTYLAVRSSSAVAGSTVVIQQ